MGQLTLSVWKKNNTPCDKSKSQMDLIHKYQQQKSDKSTRKNDMVSLSGHVNLYHE